ncbi:glycoside hydrolase family 15 protein [Streptomyces sp. NPDC050848]|uniref:glycoside hydrolase family 15 protein n=1 Tax=Streptomyces sp. NPDC050848 TaxID=3155791 RepID=UPI0033FFAD4A
MHPPSDAPRIGGYRVRREALRRELHDEVCALGWSDVQRSYVQYYGAHRLDATALLIARLGFLPATDPRVLSTVDAMGRLDDRGFLRRDADVGDGEVHEVDGLDGAEGAFLACTFWYADALAMTGRPAEAAPSSSGSSTSATTWACSPRSGTRTRGASSATPRRRSATSPW